MGLAPSFDPSVLKKPMARYFAGNGMIAPFEFTMAFQPIVDLERRHVFAYEALVRGRQQQGAREMLDRVNGENMYAFDQSMRVRAIEMATQLGVIERGASLSINFLPGALYRPEHGIRKTLETAARVGMPLDRIIFEVTEDQRVIDHLHLKNIFREYRKHGLLTAIDDFGSGYSGLTLLADFQPDVLKVDRALVGGIDRSKPARSIMAALVQICRTMEIKLVAEGIERAEEAMVLHDMGVCYMQGFFFGRPAFERLGEPIYGVIAA
jgi:EAL domain-containing protein (putative c-di-GMP-specific phosphodiesterase class I)